jgi:flagellar basal-body rod modification protein FlgD
MSISPTQSNSAASALTSASTATPSTADPTGSSTLGESSFLQLLTAQLQNQDPLNPTSDSDFVAELAQFSSVEQMTTANTTLQQLVVGQASTNQTADAGLVGKSVLYNSDQISLTATQLASGQPATFYANFGSDAQNVTATITNSQGQVVRTVQLGPQAAGQDPLSWDGKDDSGNLVPPGTYSVQLTATDQSGNPVTVTQEAQSLVTGISFQNSYPELVVSTGDIQLSDVNEIDLPS